MKNNTNKKNIYLYITLTFFISWVLWSPFYFSETVNEFLVLPGAWGPTISAIILMYWKHGKKGIRELLSKLLIWKVSFIYYMIAIFGVLLVGGASLAIYQIFGGNLVASEIILNSMGLAEGEVGLGLLLLPLFFIINTLLGGPIAEELGWRGYAQAALQEKYSPNLSGFIIGLIWSLWHLPLIIFMPKAIGHLPIVAYIPLMTAMGVIFSWLYNRTRGSVLLAILLHGGMNFTHGFLGADVLSKQNLLIIQVSFIVIVAVGLALNNKRPLDYKK